MQDALQEKLHMVCSFNGCPNWWLLFSHFIRKNTNLSPKNSVTLGFCFFFCHRLNPQLAKTEKWLRQGKFMNSGNTNQSETSSSRTCGHSPPYWGSGYMPLPAGQSKHVYPNLPEITSCNVLSSEGRISGPGNGIPQVSTF